MTVRRNERNVICSYTENLDVDNTDRITLANISKSINEGI